MIGSSDYYASAQLQSVVYQVLMLDQKIRQNNDKNNYKSNETYLIYNRVTPANIILLIFYRDHLITSISVYNISRP